MPFHSACMYARVYAGRFLALGFFRIIWNTTEAIPSENFLINSNAFQALFMLRHFTMKLTRMNVNSLTSSPTFPAYSFSFRNIDLCQMRALLRYFNATGWHPKFLYDIAYNANSWTRYPAVPGKTAHLIKKIFLACDRGYIHTKQLRYRRVKGTFLFNIPKSENATEDAMPCISLFSFFIRTDIWLSKIFLLVEMHRHLSLKTFFFQQVVHFRRIGYVFHDRDQI